jgi:ubiquinone/menaquinone biosynthesis C-methylase UbiE
MIYKPLNIPFVYRLANNLIAPGYETNLTQLISELRSDHANKQTLLDVGCGPQSWLWQVGLKPVGLDLSHRYCTSYHARGEPAVTASAAELPFASQSFGEVWSIGLLHHLPDALVCRTIDEMHRVCRGSGRLVIMDAVMPQHSWKAPFAYLARRYDRGRFVRRQDAFEALLPERAEWQVKRVRYSLTGLEIVACWRAIN